MAKKEKKFKPDNLFGTVKTGKEFWDAHVAELTEAVKKVIPKKGEKVSDNNIMGVVKAGQSAWTDSDRVEEPEYLPEDEGEDTFFEDKLDNLWDTVKNTDPKNPQEVMAAIATLTQISNETIQYVAEQETKREEIRAERDVAIARIHAMSDSIKLYLEKTFDERSAIFAKQFECVDAALRDGNTEMLASTLNNINSLAASSPFKNLADINQVQQALGDSSTEWDI